MRKVLQEARKTKGCTQKQVADYLGMITQAYEKIEYGTRGTSEDRWLKLYKFFDEKIQLDKLMENT